jgi:hypothetical protein
MQYQFAGLHVTALSMLYTVLRINALRGMHAAAG